MEKIVLWFQILQKFFNIFLQNFHSYKYSWKISNFSKILANFPLFLGETLYRYFWGNSSFFWQKIVCVATLRYRCVDIYPNGDIEHVGAIKGKNIAKPEVDFFAAFRPEANLEKLEKNWRNYKNYLKKRTDFHFFAAKIKFFLPKFYFFTKFSMFNKMFNNTFIFFTKYLTFNQIVDLLSKLQVFIKT